eukprot:1220630-Pleurochrysis_carterae.AAC.1
MKHCPWRERMRGVWMCPDSRRRPRGLSMPRGAGLRLERLSAAAWRPSTSPEASGPALPHSLNCTHKRPLSHTFLSLARRSCAPTFLCSRPIARRLAHRPA